MKIKQEKNGGGERQDLKLEYNLSGQSGDDHDRNGGDVDLDNSFANSGNITVVTSTPKQTPKALFTQQMSSSQNATLKRKIQNLNGIGARYMSEFFTHKDNDASYGLRVNPESDKYMLGNQLFEVNEKTDVIRIGDRLFPGSFGVFELICKKYPQDLQSDDEQF